MISLKLAGKFDYLAGLVVGGFTDMKDHQNPFGKKSAEIIKEHVSEFDFPVCFDFPAGHIINNQPLVVGANYILNVNDDYTEFFLENQ